MQLDDRTFAQFSALFFQETGIRYTGVKRALVENRLAALVGSERRYPDFESLLAALRSPGSDALRQTVVGRMTTHYTYFFREPIHFAFLQQRLLGPWSQRADLHILSAACSGGQEAWSAAITAAGAGRIAESQGRSARLPRVHIVGHDIAASCIEQAQAAVYPERDIFPHLERSLAERYLTPLGDGRWSIANHLRPLAEFSVRNLLDAKAFPEHRYDLVFLRNVLIYFRRDERIALLELAHKVLKPDGFLIISLSESIAELGAPFRLHRYGIHSPR